MHGYFGYFRLFHYQIVSCLCYLNFLNNNNVIHDDNNSDSINEISNDSLVNNSNNSVDNISNNIRSDFVSMKK